MARHDRDVVLADAQAVALVAERAIPGREREDDVAGAAGCPRHGQPEPRCGPESACEEPSHARHLGRRARGDDPRRRSEAERPSLRRLRERLRDHARERRRDGRRGAAHDEPRSNERHGERHQSGVAPHPRTAPAVSPNMILRCTSRKNTMTGIAVSVEAAISPPQSVLRLPP